MAASGYRWLVCTCVLLFHWLVLVFLYMESAPQNNHIPWDDRLGFRRGMGLVVYGWPTVDADDCNMDNCFNRSWCGETADNFTISLYPPGESTRIQGLYGTLVKPSKWWIRVRASLKASKYFVQDPSKACVIVPNFEHTLASNEAGAPLVITKALRDSDTWNRYGVPGSNHLLFNKNDDIGVEYDTSYAMVAKVGWSNLLYRPSFDISMAPPLGKSGEGLRDKDGKPVNYWDKGPDQVRQNKYFLTFLGTFRNHPIRQKMAEQFHDPENGVYIQSINCTGCVPLDYVESLISTQFALCPRGLGLYSYRVAEAISAGAIPVIIGDRYVYPFEEVLDWRSFAVIIPEASWRSTMDILRSFSEDELARMRKNLYRAHERIFKNDQAVMDTTLDILRMNIYGTQEGKKHYKPGQYKHLVSHPYSDPFYHVPSADSQA